MSAWLFATVTHITVRSKHHCCIRLFYCLVCLDVFKNKVSNYGILTTLIVMFSHLIMIIYTLRMNCINCQHKVSRNIRIWWLYYYIILCVLVRLCYVKGWWFYQAHTDFHRRLYPYRRCDFRTNLTVEWKFPGYDLFLYGPNYAELI